MRSLHKGWAAAVLVLGLAPAWAEAQYKAADILKSFHPTQAGVEVDSPTDPAVIEGCTVETQFTKERIFSGLVVRDPQGKILIKLVDTRASKGRKPRFNQWSYYLNGFEVYREVDNDDDKVIDEIHWLNSGGTRVALQRDSKITGWKRISAEEASKEFVRGLNNDDDTLIESLMATPEELTSIGAPKGLIDETGKAAAGRTQALAALRKSLTGWDDQTVWQRFDGTLPHVIPADAGLKEDVTLYENAFIFVTPADGQGNPLKLAYLQVPELVRIGENWKFVELPRAINPEEPVAMVADNGLRSWLYSKQGGETAPTEDPALREALDALAKHDQQNGAEVGASKKSLAEYHYKRVRLLDAVAKATKNEEDRLNYNKQIVDSLAAAYQTGFFPDGLGVIDRYVAMGGPVGSYAAYRKIQAEYTLAADQPGADFLKIQKEYLGKLEEFLGKFADSDEAPQALFQLASVSEFNAEEDKAREYYNKLASEHPDTEDGKKAAGALRRLDLVGKSFELNGDGLQGKPINTSAYRGKTLLVLFWTTTAEPVRRDVPELVKLYEKYRGKGFEVVGVNLDLDKESLTSFLKDSPLPWAQIYEPGGLDSRLADEYGIISLPTMILVDGEGKVLSRNLRSSSDLEKYLENLFSDDPAKLGLGTR